MNALFSRSFPLAAAAIITILSSGHGLGQAAKADGGPPTFDDIPSPEFNTGKNKSFKPGDWLELEAKLNISMSPEPPSKTCEKITVKWYVAIKNPEKPSSMLLLTKDVEHVNVPLGEDIFASIYLSPGSIKRVTGSSKGGKSAVEIVGYEVLYNGTKIAEATTKFKPGWWNAASEKIARSETVPLLTKPETPFSNMWWDRYAENGVERR